MAKQTTVSLRVSTRGEITEFLEQERKQCAYSNQVISGLVGKLWNYKEEGVELSPSIIFCDDIMTFGRALPGYSRIFLGECVAAEDSAKKILKDCAPLTGDSSMIFIERKEDGKHLHYGIFSFLRSPTAMGIDEALCLDQGQFVILIKKSASTAIKIAGSKGNSISILMSTLQEEDTSEADINRFIYDLASDIVDPDGQFQKYLKKMISRELIACHGTILICVKGDQHPQIDEISDYITFDTPIDLFGRSKISFERIAPNPCLNFSGAEELFRGFLACDGMIMFSTSGKIISYRVFYQSTKVAEDKLVVGGARKRAFAGVGSIRSNQLKSALFRSQDGNMEYAEIVDEQL